MITLENFKNVNDRSIGFYISEIDRTDLKLIRDLIERHFKEWIIKNFSSKDVSFANYLKSCDQERHGLIFTKKNRVLPKNLFDIAHNNLKIFKNLKKIYPEFEITDEENLGFGNFYWRLVRPYPYKDVGPMHKDKWFWDLGSGKIDENKYRRNKLWISVIGDQELGFRFVKGSPNMDLNFKSEYRDGMKKPMFDEKNIEKSVTSLRGSNGTFIIFNDELLHGGKVLNNETVRISIECTFLTKK